MGERIEGIFHEGKILEGDFKPNRQKPRLRERRIGIQYFPYHQAKREEKLVINFGQALTPSEQAKVPFYKITLEVGTTWFADRGVRAVDDRLDKLHLFERAERNIRSWAKRHEATMTPQKERLVNEALKHLSDLKEQRVPKPGQTP